MSAPPLSPAVPSISFVRISFRRMSCTVDALRPINEASLAMAGSGSLARLTSSMRKTMNRWEPSRSAAHATAAKFTRLQKSSRERKLGALDAMVGAAWRGKHASAGEGAPAVAPNDRAVGAVVGAEEDDEGDTHCRGRPLNVEDDEELLYLSPSNTLRHNCSYWC